jgi:adenylate kinase family enzyme
LTRRIAFTGASGNGKTTVARAAAERLGVAFIEMDALNHGPDWTEATNDELREKFLAAAGDGGWVVDSSYRSKLGDLAWERADTVVWLDLPFPVVMWRLLRRTRRRLRTKEVLWNGNVEPGWRESVPYLIWPAAKTVFSNRRTVPELARRQHLAHLQVVRLRSQEQVQQWLAELRPAYESQASDSIAGSSGPSTRQKTPPSVER